MLKINNFGNLRGDFVEYNDYTLYIDNIIERRDYYRILVGLKQNGKIQDYISVELSRYPKENGNYTMHQSANPHYMTEVTVNCIENLDWFGYMTCQMVGTNSWQLNIPFWTRRNKTKIK